MFIRDAFRPIARKRMLEGFRFTNTFKRISHRLLNHVVDAAKDLSIGVLPIEIVVPGMIGKNELHSTSSFSAPSLFSSWEIDSISLLVFLGDRKR